MLTLPGLIDPHVHLRDPGQTHKEDFTTGSEAALAGGFTTILDMPNNLTPITTLDLLTQKEQIAAKKIVCDIGFFFGSLGDNLTEFEKVQNRVFGLKLFLNPTTGNFTITPETFKKICTAWQKTNRVSCGRLHEVDSDLVVNPVVTNHPILVHAEADILEKTINIAHTANQPLHVCHIGSSELKIIIKAKKKGHKITCGVTPHHLFLNENYLNTLGALGTVKPPLQPQSGVEFLWQNLDYIDIIESDHAPHTLEEKQKGAFGFPGLETTLPLLLTAMHQKKLTIMDIKRLCHDNPAKIFSIQTDPKTYIEIDEKKEWTIKNENLKTKSGWSPFNEWRVKGKVKKVFIRGAKVFEDEKILINPGFGKITEPA